MHRRTFVRVLTSGGVALVAQPHLAGCQSGPSSAYAAWNGPSPVLADEDVRLRIVSYGLLAPSTANLQPWWVSLKHPGILVAIEPHRLQPHSDPGLHQTYVSHGAFLETLRLASGTFGLAASVVPFPHGEPSSADPFDLPVARIDLAPNGTLHPLAQHLTHRRTNRRPFRNVTVPSSELDAVSGAVSPGVSVHWFSEPENRSAIANAILESAAASLESPERYREAIASIRWTEQDIDATRDGVSLEHLGLSTWSRWYEQAFRSRADVEGGGWSDRLLEMTRRQAVTASAFGILSTRTSGRTAELAAGASLMRIHLAATARGIAFQPLNAPIAQRSALPAGLLPSGSVPHLLFRVGYADETIPSPRRTLFEVVRL